MNPAITPSLMDSNPDPVQGGERVAKVMSRAGLCSRREAEGWIKAGRVAVNGAIIASPALDVTPDDRIEVDGQPLPQRERTRLFLYHKPRGLVTTNADPQGRPTIFQALPKDLPRLITVGRLDLASEGLLLLTNDGALARALELPSTGWERRYRARALGTVAQHRLDKLRRGITVDGMRYGPIEASIDHESGANMWLTVSIREGRNREVRNVLRAVGLAVNRLIRVAFGPFELGELPEGAIDEVSTRQLRQALGEELAAKIGADFSGPTPGRISATTQAPLRFRPSRRERFEEKERASREEKSERSARPERSERPARAERSERPARAERGERHDRAVPPARSAWRDADGRSDNRDAAPPEPSDKPRKRVGKHHSDTRVWRGDGAPLRRKFRGDRRERGDDEKPVGPKREGIVADRKGRTVVVERFGEPKIEEAPKRKYWREGPAGKERPRGERSEGKRGDHPGGKRSFRPDAKPGGRKPFDRRAPRRDRSGGPRPSRPKG